MKYFLLAFVTASIATTVNGQTASKIVGKTPPVAATFQYRSYWDRNDGKPKTYSSKTIYIKQAELHNQPTWMYIQEYKKATDNTEPYADTTFFDPATLAPLEYHSHVVEPRVSYSEIITFTNGTVRTKIYYRDSLHYDERPLPIPRVHSTMEAYLFSLLPLREGYAADFAMINSGKNHQEYDQHVEVLGSEEIEFENFGKVDCWKISLEKEKGKRVAWYTKKQPQVLMRQAFYYRENMTYYTERVM